MRLPEGPFRPPHKLNVLTVSRTNSSPITLVAAMTRESLAGDMDMGVDTPVEGPTVENASD